MYPYWSVTYTTEALEIFFPLSERIDWDPPLFA